MPTEDYTQDERCPVCDSSDLDDAVEALGTICTQCGYVIQDASIELPEEVQQALAFEPSEEETPAEWSETYTVTNSVEERVGVALEALEALAVALDLPAETRKQAATLFGEATKQKATDGRNTADVVGALLCLTTRHRGEPIPITRIAREVDTERQSLARLVHRLREDLNLDATECRPEDYVPALSRELEFDEDVIAETTTYIRRAREEGLTNGRNPAGIAGAALYGAAEGAESQRTVARVAGVSKETLRVRIKEFRNRSVFDE
ncbi:hypothetical protein [Halomicrococcus sp. NG-SE-24]|uniref:hypothetical protein n=1 Tax=Halomicrococcus sp. NG-SE-24 TaxID=3436928 RepID=UPI003D95A1D5